MFKNIYRVHVVGEVPNESKGRTNLDSWKQYHHTPRTLPRFVRTTYPNLPKIIEMFRIMNCRRCANFLACQGTNLRLRLPVSSLSLLKPARLSVVQAEQKVFFSGLYPYILLNLSSTAIISGSNWKKSVPKTWVRL